MDFSLEDEKWISPEKGEKILLDAIKRSRITKIKRISVGRRGG